MDNQPVQYMKSLKSPGNDLCGLAWDGEFLWHSDGSEHQVYQLSPVDGSVKKKISCKEIRAELAYDGTNLWQIVGDPKRVKLIRPNNGDVVHELSLGLNSNLACGLSVDHEGYWIGWKKKHQLERRSFESHTIIEEYHVNADIAGLVKVGKQIWYTDYEQSLLIGIDTNTGEEIGTYSIQGKPTGLTWDGTMFWYNDFSSKRIVAIQIVS